MKSILTVLPLALLLCASAHAELSVTALGPNNDPNLPVVFRVVEDAAVPSESDTRVLVIRAYSIAGQLASTTLVPLASVNGQDCSESGDQCFMLGRTDQRPNGRYFYYAAASEPASALDVTFLPSELCSSGELQGREPLGCARGFVKGPLIIQFAVLGLRDPSQPLTLGDAGDAGEILTLPMTR